MSDRQHAYSLPALCFEPPTDYDLRFPPLPRTVTEVSNLLAEEQDEPDLPRLADIVGTDPILAASILRRVNAAFYGLRSHVGDIDQAVKLLGFEEVCHIALTAGIVQLKTIMTTDEQAFVFHEIMQASVGAAYYTRELAQHLALPLQAKAFTVGLLHAVGRLVLLYSQPEDYEVLWYITEEDFGPRANTEKAIFGLDHGELGDLAMRAWHLPPLFAVITCLYLRPEELNIQDLRALALTLSVAVSAAEQVCLSVRDADGPSRARQPFFTAPEALHTLAQEEGHEAATLVRLITSKREQALSYIETMV